MAQKPSDLKIPGYRILRELGCGGMANVYLAEQQSIEREVALKVMLPALAASDSSFSVRFLREAKIVARLAHPHITAVYDVGVAGPYHYFSMEYVTGGDLKARIREGMAPNLVFTITRQIAAALAFAHAKGYVHRDVKPENVLFRQDGTALLSDFGVAKSTDAANQMTATGVIIGTPNYMSPEQAQGQELDQRSDLYSLGVMVYEMLTGSVPYAGTSAVSVGIQHLKEPIPRLAPPCHVYQRLIDKLLAKNPADRFQDGEELIAAINAKASGITTSTVIRRPASDQTVIRRPGPSGNTARQKRLPLFAGITLGVLLLSGGLYFLTVRDSRGPAPAVPVASTAPANQQATQIAGLLAEADKAADSGQYLEPRETSAVTQYRKVQELDATNRHAARRLREIARNFLTQAERAMEAKDLERAESLLNNAAEADPSHPLLLSNREALTELRRQQSARASAAARAPPATTAKPAAAAVARVQDVSETRKNEERIDALVARIQELTSPANLNATRLGLSQELLAEATRTAPDDARVNKIPGQIADGYLRLAATKVEEKEYKDADALIRRGLELKPDHRLLLSLQKDAMEKQKPRHRAVGGF